MTVLCVQQQTLEGCAILRIFKSKHSISLSTRIVSHNIWHITAMYIQGLQSSRKAAFKVCLEWNCGRPKNSVLFHKHTSIDFLLYLEPRWILKSVEETCRYGESLLLLKLARGINESQWKKTRPFSIRLTKKCTILGWLRPNSCRENDLHYPHLQIKMYICT